MKHWGPAIALAERVGLPVSVPTWARLRNYELESRLFHLFGNEYVISEWCPFNGIYCGWAAHAPEVDLKTEIARLAQDRDKPEVDVKRLDHAIKTLQQELARRGVRDGKW